MKTVLLSMYRFLTKHWNCAARLLAFLDTRHGAHRYFFVSLWPSDLVDYNRADYITEVKMIKTGKGIEEAMFSHFLDLRLMGSNA